MADDPKTPAPSGFTYSVSRGEGSVVTVAVDIEPARVRAATDRVFQRRVRQAKIPGFRPGKAPRAIYERTYGTEHLWHEAAEDVVDETYREIVQREELEPLDRPDVELGDLTPEAPVHFTATFPVRPEVTLGDYAAHGSAVEPTPVSEEDVERTIAGMRGHHAELRPVQRPAQKGDVVTLDLDATIDGREVPLGRGAHIELGLEYGIPGLAEGLIGATVGEERILDLAFPEDHTDETLRGRSGSFRAKVTQVAEKLLPDLDDGFAKTVGVADLKALRRAVRSELAHGSFHQARDAAAERLMTHLLETSDVTVPDVLVNDELDHLVAELKDRVAQQGITYEKFLLQARKTEEQVREEWRPAAERRAKALLVLDAIAKKEGVTISGAELAQEVGQTPLAQDPQALRDPAVLASLARSLRNRKLIDKLIGLEGPDAEREAIKRAGGPEDEAEPALIIPESVPTHSAEDREAIRSLLKG
jgi:trigger factor